MTRRFGGASFASAFFPAGTDSQSAVEVVGATTWLVFGSGLLPF